MRPLLYLHAIVFDVSVGSHYNLILILCFVWCCIVVGEVMWYVSGYWVDFPTLLYGSPYDTMKKAN